MKKILISKGYKKYIRAEKSKIRKEILDPIKADKKIKELYSQFSEKEK